MSKFVCGKRKLLIIIVEVGLLHFPALTDARSQDMP